MTATEISPEGIEAPPDEKTIEVTVRFSTDEIAPNGILPKHAWDWGTVQMKPNLVHGIYPTQERHFHSMMELGAAIERTLVDHGIKLRPEKNSLATKLYES